MEKSGNSKLVKIHPGIQKACVLGAFFLSTGPLKDHHATTFWKNMFLRLKYQVWTRQQQIQTWIGMSRKSPPPQEKLTNCTSPFFLSFKTSTKETTNTSTQLPHFLIQKKTPTRRAQRASLPPLSRMTRYEYVTREIGVPTCVLTAADCDTAKELPQWVPLTGRRAEFQVGWVELDVVFWVCWCCVCFLLGAGVGGKLRMLMMNMTIDKDQIFGLRVVGFLNNMFLKCL